VAKTLPTLEEHKQQAHEVLASVTGKDASASPRQK